MKGGRVAAAALLLISMNEGPCGCQPAGSSQLGPTAPSRTRPPARHSHMIEAAGNGNSRSHLTWLAKAGRVREEGLGG